MTSIEDIYDEQANARAKHGERYMGNITTIYQYDAMHSAMTAALLAALGIARHICDGPNPTRMAILAEEVCELAEDLARDECPNTSDELIQVAAMALAWLGVER